MTSHPKREKEARDSARAALTSCVPAANGEEAGCPNGSLPRGRTETTVILLTDPSEIGPPVKPPFNAHRIRNFAIGSIICGCSCIGVLALIYAIKASEKRKANFLDSANYWARKSQRLSFLSIGVWVSLLILVPLSMVLISYLISQAE